MNVQIINYIIVFFFLVLLLLNYFVIIAHLKLRQLAIFKFDFFFFFFFFFWSIGDEVTQTWKYRDEMCVLNFHLLLK